MKRTEIEFFHDVICSFCYPMSYIVRQVAADYPDVHIKHRSFALAPEAQAFDEMFGSRDKAKAEVLSHWAQANALDPLHRFDIEGMRKESFPFPTSMKPLTAAKAAGVVGGEEAYWDVFDALQAGLFSQSRNIEDEGVILDIVRKINLDFDAWKAAYTADSTQELIQQDLLLAEAYGIHVVPTLVVDKERVLSGVRSMDELHLLFASLQKQQ